MPGGAGGRALEGVLYVGHAGGFTREEFYTDDVEAKGAGPEAFILEVHPGQGAQLPPLPGGHGLERVAESGAAAQLHLDEDDGDLVGQDQVYLPEAGAVVALEEGVAALLEVPQGEVLAQASRRSPTRGVGYQGATPE